MILKGKDIYLMIGATGTGKSTLIQYCCGSQMRKIFFNGLPHIEAAEFLNKDLEGVRLSPFAKSETRYVKPIELNLSHISQEFIGKKITLVDSPGSEDTESQEIDLANGFGIVKAIEGAKSVVPIVVLSYKNIGTRSQVLKQTINFIGKMLRSVNNISKFNFVINHMPMGNTEEENKKEIKA